MHGRQRGSVWLLVPIWTLGVLACGSAQNAGTKSGTGAPAAADACFNVRNVDSFSPLSGRFVYLRHLSGAQYLLTLDTVYLGLPNARGIKIENGFSRVCSDSGARIRFLDFDRPVFCRIIRVEAVASVDAARQLVKDRSAPGHRE
jgi:hypothetical protein